MCYRCGLCRDVVPHNVPMRKVVSYRKAADGNRQEIAKETPVCEKCDPNNKTLTVQLPIMASVPSRNGGNKRKVVHEPVCDVCSKPIGNDGQQTAESTLCKDHLPKRKGRK